jgi:predicted Fe-S protein YdhL (DUF1289 family)
MRFKYVSLKKLARRPIVHICRTDTETWCKAENGCKRQLQGLHEVPENGRFCKNCETVRDEVESRIGESISRKLDAEFRAIMA